MTWNKFKDSSHLHFGEPVQNGEFIASFMDFQLWKSFIAYNLYQMCFMYSCF